MVYCLLGIRVKNITEFWWILDIYKLAGLCLNSAGKLVLETHWEGFKPSYQANRNPIEGEESKVKYGRQGFAEYI